MPYSNRDNEPWVAAEILRLQPARTLDVGPGAGAYGQLMVRTLPQARRDAIEIWEPYIAQFDLTSLYHQVQVADARAWDDWDYDLVFFGDVIEHMTESEAREVWTRVSAQARAAIISVPIIHYPQGEYEGNPYEIHQEEDWNTERVLETFTGITKHIEFQATLTPAEMEYHHADSQTTSVAGTYLAEF